MPPSLTAVGRVSRAVARLEERPMPASLTGPGGEGLRAMAPVLPFATRFALANEWLLGPVIERQLSAAPATNAIIRTTTAPTIIGGGVKDNVLPSEARAVVNYRLAPGDTIAKVRDHTIAAVDDASISVSQYGTLGNEASPVADEKGPGYQLIAKAIGAVAPDALVAPGIVVGGTDSRHYGKVADSAYRFLPLRLTPSDTPRIHGTNERISVANYGEIISFYQALIREGAGAAN
jgi:carboxypeptidase PM20D1